MGLENVCKQNGNTEMNGSATAGSGDASLAAAPSHSSSSYGSEDEFRSASESPQTSR